MSTTFTTFLTLKIQNADCGATTLEVDQLNDAVDLVTIKSRATGVASEWLRPTVVDADALGTCGDPDVSYIVTKNNVLLDSAPTWLTLGLNDDSLPALFLGKDVATE